MHILNDCPENGPSSTKVYKFFEAKIINFKFFKNFDKKKPFHFTQSGICLLATRTLLTKYSKQSFRGSVSNLLQAKRSSSI